jgi:hypothetical protein
MSDTANKYTVARNRDVIFVMTPPRAGEAITRDEAIAFAAWLLAMAAPRRDALERVDRVIAQIT